ncbi:MAG: fibronectin type III domain-containing protein, partial [Sphingobacteriales bacterium]
MKKIYFLLLTVMFLGALNSNAQVNTYQWSALTGLTYTELTGGTVINTDAQLSTGTIGASADDGAVLITLPFTFTFNGVGYTQVTMCTNGWVGMGNQLGITPAQGRAAGNLFTNVVPNNLIGGWFGDGSANFPAPNPGSMVYGPRGTDVFVFEWKSATGNGFTASTTNLISFQIVIYGPGSTSPGRIETLYGAATGTPSTGRTIGLGGTGTDFINGLTGSTTSTATAAAWPGNGNGFRFNPAPPCVAPTSLAATVSVTPATTTVSGSFTAAATAPSGYLVVRTTSNVAPVPVAGTNYTVGSSPIGYIEYVNTAAGSWTSTSLTATTQYYYWIFSYNNTLCAGGPLYSSTATTTSTTTLAAGAITSVGTGGLWSAPGTWSTGAVPTANDAVTIAAGSPVTIDIAALAYSLTVNGSLTYEAATARTLTVSTDVTVNAGGTFGTAASGTVTTHSLSLAGNLVNDGVIDFSIATAATNVVFTGLTNSTFSGAGAVTDLAGLSLSKTTRDIIVELNLSNFSVGGLSTASTGTLLTSNTGTGTLKISGTNTFSGTLWSVPAYTIPATLGIWLNNPNFTVTGLTGSATLAGLFRISQGTYGIGTAAGNSLGFSTGAIVTIEGGNVVAAGRFGVGAAANVITYTQTGGAILVSTAGNVSTTLASFDLGTGLTSTISITGGTITVQTASTAGSGPRDYRVQSGVGLDAVTGGTVFIGNAATTANSIFNVTGIFPDLVLTNTSGSHSTIFGTVANYNHAARNVTINTGDSLNLSNNPFLFAGTAFVNNGKLTHNGASSRFITFRANTNMTYSGTGTVTAPMTSLELQNDLNFTFDPAVNNVVANRVIIFNGNFVNANKITLGNGGTTSAIIQYGNTTTPTAGGNFDVAPTFNLGTGGQSISYLRTTNPKTTGVEINPSRILTNLSVDDNVNVLNVAGGDLTVTGTFSMTNGNIINGTNLITLGTSTSAGTLSHGASNPFITGSFARTFRAGRTASSLYSDSTKYPVGKGSAYLPFYFDPTVSASGAITLTAEAFASNTGTPGSGVTNLANVRWQTSAINGGANLTGAFLSIGQSGIVSTSKILQATSGAGVYVELPGGSDLFAGTPNTLRSNSAVAAANYTGFLSYGDFQPACPSPSAVTVSATTGTTASVSFTGSGPFILEYGTPGFTPGIDNNAGGGTIITSATSPITITGLSPLTTYQVYVRANCSGTGNGYSNNSSPVSFTTTLINDQAPGAISLAVNAGCTGAIYTNVGASASAGENFPSCSGARFTPVWFSFVAPATGAV